MISKGTVRYLSQIILTLIVK